MKFKDSQDVLHFVVMDDKFDVVVRQLQKDFSLARVAVEFKNISKQEDLIAVLHEKIYVLLMEQFNVYLNLMYVIDVPEASFKNVKANNAVDVSKEVVFLILKREYQKIILRAKYSS